MPLNSYLGPHGTIGFIATKTIAEGDTRATGLKKLVNAATVIYEATRSMKWPTPDANVAVAIVHMAKGHLTHLPGLRRRLDGQAVETINSALRPTLERQDPTPLRENVGLCYQGAVVLGMGFTLTPEQHAALIKKNPRNAERIFPYLGGEEINTSPTQSPDRFVISFGDMSLKDAERWPDLVDIVRQKVKPERDQNNRQTYRDNWWHFGEKRPELSEALRKKRRCLVTSIHSKHLIFSLQPTDRIFSHGLFVFLVDDNSRFAILQSRIHEGWARLLSSSLEDRLRYSASDCLDTFPFPAVDRLGTGSPLDAIGTRLDEYRVQVMVERNQGLTDTYNQLKDRRCDDPAIVALRRLHEDMDRAVLAAYGWSDIPVPPCETPTTDAARKALEAFEDEVIDRLFALNAQRAQEERLAGAGKAVKKSRRGAPGNLQANSQLELAPAGTRGGRTS